MKIRATLDKWLFGQPGGVLGTRSLVTIIIVGITAAMWFLEIDISETQEDVVKLVLAFYFITRAVQGGTNGVGTDGVDQPTKPPAE